MLKRSGTNSILPSLKGTKKQTSKVKHMKKLKNDKYVTSKIVNIPKPPLNNLAVKEKSKPLNDQEEIHSALTTVAKRDMRELKRGSLTSQFTAATTPCVKVNTNKFN